MRPEELADIYRAYITCLNAQDWDNLGRHVHDEASHNGKTIGLSGYRSMLEKDYADIPDLYFDIELLVCEPPYVASRLAFNCSPKGRFLGLDINGKKVSFRENVFYEFREGKVWRVQSILDKLAIEAQIGDTA